MATKTVELLVCDQCGKDVEKENSAAGRWITLTGSLEFRSKKVGGGIHTLYNDEHKDFCGTTCLFQSVEDLREAQPMRSGTEGGLD